MYVLIMCHVDGDRYQLSNNLDVLKARFEKEKEEFDTMRIHLDYQRKNFVKHSCEIKLK